MSFTHFFGPALLAAAILISTPAADAATSLDNLPAPTSFTIAGAGLDDGRFVIYNGDAIFYQNAVGADGFTQVASGYEGDPAFIIVSPSGNRLLLGAGGFGQPYTGKLYEMDADSPMNFTPVAIVANQAHFGAVFLTESLVLIDSGDFTDSQLDIIELDAKSLGARTVVHKPQPKDVVVDPKPGYSASLAYDVDSGRVYAMDANARELRWFSDTELVSAFTGSTLLDWEDDGTLVGAAGDYVGGGAAGVTTQGYVVLGGSLGFTGAGMVQVVNPVNGDIINTLDPAGDDGYTNVIMNNFTGAAIVQQSGQDFLVGEAELITLPVQPTLPLAGPAGMAALCALLALGGRRAVKR